MFDLLLGSSSGVMRDEDVCRAEVCKDIHIR